MVHDARRKREIGLIDDEKAEEEAGPPLDVEPETGIEPGPDAASERAETWGKQPASDE